MGYGKIKVKEIIIKGDRKYNLSFKNRFMEREIIHVKGKRISKIKNEGFEEYEKIMYLYLDFDLETGECIYSYRDYGKWFIDLIRNKVLKIKEGQNRRVKPS